MKFFSIFLLTFGYTIHLAAQPAATQPNATWLYGRMILTAGKSQIKDSPTYGIIYKNRQNLGLTFVFGGQHFGFAVSYFGSAFDVDPKKTKQEYPDFSGFVLSGVRAIAMTVDGFSIGPSFSAGLDHRRGLQFELSPSMGVQSIRIGSLILNNSSGGHLIPASRSVGLVFATHLQVRYAFWKGVSAGIMAGATLSHDTNESLFEIVTWSACLAIPLF